MIYIYLRFYSYSGTLLTRKGKDLSGFAGQLGAQNLDHTRTCNDEIGLFYVELQSLLLLFFNKLMIFLKNASVFLHIFFKIKRKYNVTFKNAHITESGEGNATKQS